LTRPWASAHLFVQTLDTNNSPHLTTLLRVLCFGHTSTMALDLTTIQRALRARRITWRYHALLRAQERGITRAQAVQVLIEGEIIEQRPRAKPYPQCLMMKAMSDNRPLYVSLGYNQRGDRIGL